MFNVRNRSQWHHPALHKHGDTRMAHSGSDMISTLCWSPDWYLTDVTCLKYPFRIKYSNPLGPKYVLRTGEIQRMMLWSVSMEDKSKQDLQDIKLGLSCQHTVSQRPVYQQIKSRQKTSMILVARKYNITLNIIYAPSISSWWLPVYWLGCGPLGFCLRFGTRI